ncbi:MAG: tyrosine-type recombinase/integrase [Bdellovibrionaceae bacterium]|jgi:site-specific recombinase XerD|nr:tyrosine-type recombinase/integrase [Pseudobdellovibrionaceae bacterium]
MDLVNVKAQRCSSLVVQCKDDGQYYQENLMVTSWLQGKADNTKRAYFRIVRDFFVYYSNKSIKDITAEDISFYIFKFCEALKDSTKKQIKDCLSSLFSYALKTAYIPFNPVATISRIKVPNKLFLKVPSQSQILKIVNSCESLRNKLVIKMLYFAGLRVSEVSNLKFKDIKKEPGGFSIHIIGKGNKARHFKLPYLDIFEELQELGESKSAKMWEIDQQLIALGEPEDNFHIFRSIRSPFNNLTTRQINYLVKKEALNARIITEVYPHLFRHAHGTHAIQNGAPISVVQSTLGHESIQTTSKYLHASGVESSGSYLIKV